MAILVGGNTRVICQGMTGHAGSYHTQRMIAYGTKIVAGVTPGKGGRTALDLPVFNTVRDAKTATDANASIIFVPPANTARAMIEAIEAELSLIVCVTERVPVLDMIRVRQALQGSKTRLVGPNSQGILAPGIAQLGVMTTVNARRGSIGIASRSASLTSEVVAQVTAAGLGQSTTVGVGGDPVHGIDLKTCLELFLDDPETRGIVLIGEIGGTEEEEAAAVAARLRPKKPVVALVVGRHAPRERRMGHAGAFMAASAGNVESKIAALKAAGIRIAPNASVVGETMRQALAEMSVSA
ncbi:MAG: succinate--CoA ligase subunit alpha [Rhodomicrobiaceae bacterium]